MKKEIIDYNGNYIILSDIHGNYEALKACIEDAHNTYGNTIKGFIFLGDYACDYPGSNKVVDLIMNLLEKYPCYIISGNRETGMVRHYYEKIKNYQKELPITLEEAEQLTGWNLDTSMGCPLVDCHKLSKEQLRFLSELPETLVLENQKQTFLLKHKMPLTESELEFLVQESNKKVETENGLINRKSIVLTGHTHDPENNKYDNIKHFNPGSVALSDTGNRGAYYGILNHGILINKHVEYDYQKAIEELEKETILFERCSSWGKILKDSIITGINCATVYANENKRIIEEFKQLEPKIAKNFLELEENDAIELGKMLFPILKIEERPFSQGRYGNTNPYGGYLEKTVFEASEEEIKIAKKQLITEDIDPKEKLNSKNDFPIPTEILSIIAMEYTDEYLSEFGNKYHVNSNRWK